MRRCITFLCAVYTAYFSDDLSGRPAFDVSDDEYCTAFLPEEYNVVFWILILPLLRDCSLVADACGMGDILEIDLGDPHDTE